MEREVRVRDGDGEAEVAAITGLPTLLQAGPTMTRMKQIVLRLSTQCWLYCLGWL